MVEEYHFILGCQDETIVYAPWRTTHHWYDVIKSKHSSRYCSFVRGIHRSPADSHQKGQWRGALMFSLICAWINAWANNRDASDLRHHPAYYDVTVMCWLEYLSIYYVFSNIVIHVQTGSPRDACLDFASKYHRVAELQVYEQDML